MVGDFVPHLVKGYITFSFEFLLRGFYTSRVPMIVTWSFGFFDVTNIVKYGWDDPSTWTY